MKLLTKPPMDPGLDPPRGDRAQAGRRERCQDWGVFSPFLRWAARWSADRFHLWLATGMRPEVLTQVWLAKVACRVALGLVWCIEVLVPKILFVSPSELALVARSGVLLGTPRLTLNLLGAMEILFGLWLLSGKSERVLGLVSSVAILALCFLVAMVEPASLADPFGGISKNLGLMACGGALWFLEPLAPKAARVRA